MTDKIMALADSYAEVYSNVLAPNVNALVDEARAALLAAVEAVDKDLEDANKEADSYAGKYGVIKQLRDRQIKIIEKLEVELTKAQDELNCAEESCEAFACEFAEDGYNQGFECIGEFILALHMSSNTERDALKAENKQLRLDAERWREYKARKDAVIAAGMGRNILRDDAARAALGEQT